MNHKRYNSSLCGKQGRGFKKSRKAGKTRKNKTRRLRRH